MKQTLTMLSFIIGGFMSCGAQQTYPVETFKTDKGDEVQISLINHGSLAISYKGTSIQIDPVGNFYNQKIDYSSFPKADYILITHEHGDHLDKATIDALSKESTKLILNEKSQKQIGKGIIMNNGEQMAENGIVIKAVPAYNTTIGRENFHPKGNGNGYVLEFDGLNIYISGDTEDIPETTQLEKIDVAFLSMNQPYTMTPQQCINAAKMLQPAVLIPYHMGETNWEEFQNAFDIECSGIELKMHKELK